MEQMQDWRLIGLSPQMVMEPEVVAAELRGVISACRETSYPNPELTQNEFEALISHRFPKKEPDGETDWSNLLTKNERRTLGLQAHRVGKVFLHLDLYGGPDVPPPRWCILPWDWQERMRFLLGRCGVSLAWIVVADALQ